MVTEKPWKPDLWAQGSSREGLASGVLTGAEHPVCPQPHSVEFAVLPQGLKQHCCSRRDSRPFPLSFPFLPLFSPHLPLPPSLFHFYFLFLTRSHSVPQAGLELTLSLRLPWLAPECWVSSHAQFSQSARGEPGVPLRTPGFVLTTEPRGSCLTKKVSEVKEEDSVCDRSL